MQLWTAGKHHHTGHDLMGASTQNKKEEKHCHLLHQKKSDTVPEQRGGIEPRLQTGFHSQALTATVQNSS